MKYAIVVSGGKQFKTVEGATIEVDRLAVEIGEAISLDQVLLLVEGDSIHVGTPNVKSAAVSATVVDHFKGPKIDVFRYKPKKRIRSKIGHRQQYTRLKIDKIVME